MRTSSPFINFNNDLQLTRLQKDVLKKHSNHFINKNYVDDKIIGSTNDLTTRFYSPFLQKSFLYIITETVGDYPYPFFSEKTWKAINTGCPFMMVNAQYSLLKLQEFGFKTFNNWWDESYDSQKTVGDRIEMLVLELHKLSLLSISELEILRLEIKPILEYNLKHLKTFYKTNLLAITKSI